MKQLLGSLIFVFAGVFILSANPVGAQQVDVEDRFDPAQTLEFITGMIDRANCTPICGNPTCCIAFEQQVVTHVSKLSFDEFKQRVRYLGFSVSEFMSAAASDNSLYSEVDLQPVTDISEASAEAEWLMAEAQAIGVPLKCTVCCKACGDTVCCGGCWGF